MPIRFIVSKETSFTRTENKQTCGNQCVSSAKHTLVSERVYTEVGQSRQNLRSTLNAKVHRDSSDADKRPKVRYIVYTQSSALQSQMAVPQVDSCTCAKMRRANRVLADSPSQNMHCALCRQTGTLDRQDRTTRGSQTMDEASPTNTGQEDRARGHVFTQTPQILPLTPARPSVDSAHKGMAFQREQSKTLSRKGRKTTWTKLFSNAEMLLGIIDFVFSVNFHEEYFVVSPAVLGHRVQPC
ncbi:hypothetical protein BaRGS_00014855 [Batillaria attramentaria]|uniref:Uncharacterized protein n=1 Tax=Batillaria attramentaria TaxID=370345 RepID=A0ABD0L360_9CAEN